MRTNPWWHIECIFFLRCVLDANWSIFRFSNSKNSIVRTRGVDKTHVFLRDLQFHFEFLLISNFAWLPLFAWTWWSTIVAFGQSSILPMCGLWWKFFGEFGNVCIRSSLLGEFCFQQHSNNRQSCWLANEVSRVIFVCRTASINFRGIGNDEPSAAFDSCDLKVPGT